MAAGRCFRDGVLSAAVLAAASCARPARSAPLIDEYARAECVSPLARARVTPAAREWGSTISVLHSRKVTVVGAQVPGGIIQVRYGTSGKVGLAGTAGDYVYPSDVRVDRRLGLLYVRADGRGGGVVPETVLLEYDIGERVLLRRLAVDPAVLPRECGSS
jgi:hypothetical protein